MPLISSRPPLMAYNRVLAAFMRAPKKCICLPTRIGETQHAIAASSPQWERICSSASYCTEEVSIEIAAQKSL